MEENTHYKAYFYTHQWIQKLERNLTAKELNRLKKHFYEKKIFVDLIYPASLHYNNEQVKKMLYEYGFTIKHFEKLLFFEIARNYDVETLIKFMNEGFRLTLTKVKQLERMCIKSDIEMDNNFYNYLEEYKRLALLKKKIKKIRERNNP
jgi:hypothetical protein